MEDELIKSETAKLAKEKKFDLEVKEYFTLGLLPPNEGSVISGTNTRPVNFNEFNDTWSRPSQSLLQRWLREEHGVHIGITYMTQTKTYHSSLTMSSMGWGNFKTYEKALEKGLLEALKLIKL